MLDVCSWNNPGHNAFMGDRPSAVSSYAIPESVKAALKTKMLGLQYDDVVEITKHGIEGKDAYINMRNMHFGAGSVCKTVDMSKWASTDKEIGLVYCVEEHCIIVPTVCGNVSQIDKLPKQQALKQFPVTTNVIESFEQEATTKDIPFVAFVLPEIFVSKGEEHAFLDGTMPYRSSWDWSYSPSVGFLPAGQVVVPIPEPSTYFLTLLGIGMIGLYKWRNDKVCTLCGRVGHRAHTCPWSKYK